MLKKGVTVMKKETRDAFSEYSQNEIYYSHYLSDFVEAQEFNAEPHVHDFCELLFLKKGSPFYFVEGRSYKLKKNTLVFSRAGDRHRIYFEEDGPYERYNFLYNEKNLPFELYSRIPSSLDIINFDANTHVIELMKKADYYSENFSGEKLGYLLRGIIEEIFFNISISVKGGQTSEFAIASTNPLISKAVKYIEDNLTSPITIHTLCDELYITKSHLHHLFINHLQISPKQYILSKRLNLAKRAIRAGLKPIDACMQCGFSEYSTFYRDYKKFYGHSPSEEPDFEPQISNELDALSSRMQFVSDGNSKGDKYPRHIFGRELSK